MAKPLYGYIKLPRTLSDEECWLTADIMSRQAALIDLILRANTEPGDIRLTTGEIIHLERGQVGYSQDTLGERWGFDRNKVSRVLAYWQDKRKIRLNTDKRKTIITIIDYDCYFVPSDDATFEANPVATLPATFEANPVATLPATSEAIPDATPIATHAPLSREARKSVSGSSEGGSAKSSPNAPSLEQAIGYFASVGSDYTNGEIKAAWGAFQMSAVDGVWFTQGRVPRAITDWRLALEDEMGKRRLIYGHKNFAPPPAPQVAEGKPRTAADVLREMEEGEAQEPESGPI